MPVASARSRLGNHSATVLMEAGKLPASPTPNALRISTCIITSRPTKALQMPNTDQTISERASPILVPILSMTQPAMFLILVCGVQHPDFGADLVNDPAGDDRHAGVKRGEK